MATVKQSGGDYSTLQGAFAGAETSISIEGTWSAVDSTAATCTTASTSVTSDASSRHTGYETASPTYYRLSVSGAHALTLNVSGCTIDGIVVLQNGTGASDECIRCAPASSRTFVIKNCILRCVNNTNDQDGMYLGYNGEAGTCTVEQSIITGANRAGIKSENYDNDEVVNVNSCTIADNGRGGATDGGGVSVYDGAYTQTINIQNSIIAGNSTSSANDIHDAGASQVWNISNSIDSDNTIAGAIDAGSGNLASRTLTDNASPGAGDWIVVEDWTGSAPWDLRLKTSAENDAEDAHSNASAHGLTIPSTDIAGNTRAASFCIGAFELVSAVVTSSPPPSRAKFFANLLNH